MSRSRAKPAGCMMILTLIAHCLIPFLTVLVALIPLVPGLLSEKPIAKGWIIGAVLFGLFVLQSIVSIRDDFDHASNQTRLEQSLGAEHAALQAFSDVLGKMNSRVGAGAASLQQLTTQLRMSGLPRAQLANPDSQVIAESLAATRYARSIPRSVLSHNVDIIYFPKKVDGPQVIANLKNLGYAVTVGQPVLPNDTTNALWAGDGVAVEDVKVIALTLMRAGVAFQSVKRFCQPSLIHLHTVELGTNSSAQHRQIITPKEMHTLQVPLARDSCEQ
jgi:hypothetical protein